MCGLGSQLLSGDVHSSRNPTLLSWSCPSCLLALVPLCTWAGSSSGTGWEAGRAQLSSCLHSNTAGALSSLLGTFVSLPGAPGPDYLLTHLLTLVICDVSKVFEVHKWTCCTEICSSTQSVSNPLCAVEVCIAFTESHRVFS